MKRNRKLFVALTMIIVTMLLVPLSAFAGGTSKGNSIVYVALGDSLAAGQTPYKDANGLPQYDKGYVDVIAEKMIENQYEVSLINEGKSGLTSDHLKVMVNDPSIQDTVIKDANIITITIGANDILGALDFNTFALKEGVDPKMILGNLHINLNTILESIKKVNSDAKVYVMGYYNPFVQAMTQMPEENKQVLLSLLQGLNQSLQGAVVAQAQGGLNVSFVPTAEVINADPIRFVPNPKDVHLSKEGYQVVGEAFWKVINLPKFESGSLNIPNIELPTNHNHSIARLYARQELKMVKKEKDGQFTFYKNLKKGEYYQVYGTEGMYYNVGGSYFVKYEKGLSSIYIGRILIKENTPLYAKNGKINRTLKPGEAIKVYSYGHGKYQVGGDYYVENNSKVTYFVGYLTVKEDTVLFNPKGQKHSVLKKGKQFFVKHIDGLNIDLGGGYTVKDDKAKLSFMKN
jgi:lysophospholipase L1-like esterase